MEAALTLGAGFAHHQGSASVRRDYLAASVRSGVALLRAIKRALDPDDLLNPGVLLPA